MQSQQSLKAYTGIKDGTTYDGCKKCFYLSIVLLVVTCATLILNIIFKAYSVTQFQALIVPIAFMILQYYVDERIRKTKGISFIF